MWDARKAEAVQAARDRELGDVLEQLGRELKAGLADTGAGSALCLLRLCLAGLHSPRIAQPRLLQPCF